MTAFWGSLRWAATALIMSLATTITYSQVIDIAYLTTVPELELARTGNQDFNESAGIYVPTTTRNYGYSILGYKFWENMTNAAGGIDINGTRYMVNVTVFDVPMNSSFWPAAVASLLAQNTSSGEPHKFFFGPRSPALNYMLSREIEKLPDSLVISSSVYTWLAELICAVPGLPGVECFSAGTRRFNRTIFTENVLDMEYSGLVDTVTRAGGKTMAVVWLDSSYERPRWNSRLPRLANSSLELIYNASMRYVTFDDTTDADKARVSAIVDDLQRLDPDLVIWSTSNHTGYLFWQETQQRRWLPKALSMAGYYPFPADTIYLLRESTEEYHQRGQFYNDTSFFPQTSFSGSNSRGQISDAFAATVGKGRLNGADSEMLDTYVDGNVLAEAIRRSQSLQPSVILETIKTMPPFHQVTGVLKFDENGFNIGNTRMTVQNHYYDIKDPSRGQFGAIVSPGPSLEPRFQFTRSQKSASPVDDSKGRNLTFPIPFGCTGPQPAGTFVCDRFLRQWVASGNVVLGTNATTGTSPVPVTSPLIIKGDLTIQSTTVITANGDAQLNVTGCVNLKGGSVELALNGSAASQTLVLVVSQSNCLSGTFSSISASADRVCAKASAAPTYSSRTLAVLVTFDQSGCSEAVQTSLPIWAIGVIVGVCVLVVAVLVLVTIFVPSFRRRMFPFLNAMRVSKNRLSVRNTQ